MKLKSSSLLKLRRLVIVAAAVAFAGQGADALAKRDSYTPEPQEETLSTRDGVQLKITYFPSDAGIEATPVVLLHDYKGSRAALRELALLLQTPADPQASRRAVVTVDLRGHGDSKTAAGYDGQAVELDANLFRQDEFERMIGFDMEAVRSFLVEQNDAKKLNLNKLSLVGAGMGANIALIWAAKDWATPPLAVRKQGQDVKALALLSPAWNFKGLALNQALRQPDVRQRLSLLLAFGREADDAARDARNILRNVEKFHPEPRPDQAATQKSLFVYDLPTALQGTELATKGEFALGPRIDDFLLRRVDKQNFPWVGRKVK